MTTLLRLLLVLILAMRCAPGLADSASLFAQAKSSDLTRYTDAISKGATFAYTSDNRSFYGWWQPANWTPSAGVIVPLHGTGGYATSGLSLWLPYAEARGHAILTLSWWFGSGDSTMDYYTPSEMYPLLSGILKAKGVGPGQALFTAFSRGSANSYAVAALDYASTGQRHFGLVHSNAGGAAVDYPPNEEIIKGTYGALPFSGIPWAMYCGEKDPNPDRDGCTAMTAAKNWVTQYGAAVLLFVADPNGDHGGFMLNSSNVNQLLDQYKSLLSTSGVSGAPVCTLSASPASITTGTSATLTATCSPAATSYIWTGGTCAGTSASSCTVSPTTTTTYTVTGVNTGGTSQAASATVTVAANTTSYTVPGTLGNDVFVLTAGNFYYGGGGNDTYIISPNTLGSSVTAKIVDTEGDNLIQLVDGMTVTASAFYTDAAQLTLSNGAKVQILGASKFKFQLGANALAGDTAAVLTYTDFVTSLGASLTSGTLPVSGTAGYVVPTGFTQATAPVASVTGNASTVAGTLGDDVLVPAGGNNYLGGGGSDTYIISPYTLSGAVTAKIIDTEGTNVIQLVNGLTIASSSFFNNAVQFVLSNGAIVQILGASSFGYQLGANAPAGQAVSSQSYAQFAATLGASVPTGTSAVSGSANFVVQSSTSGTATAPTGVTVTAVLPQTVGTRSIASSTRLQVNWVAPTAGTVNHYRVDARESIGSSAASTTALSSAIGAEMGDLKAGTAYVITVTACDDSACNSGRESATVNATTSEEYWQLQGSGSTFAGLTPIVSDGNARISATRFGDDANGVTAGRIQLYYGPRLSSAAPRASLSVAASVAVVDASNPTSYTTFTSLAGSSGLMAPESSSTRIKGIGTGQGVPLSTSMGAKVRLFFESEGPDGKTRIYSIDSVDGWVGRDFNAGSSSICATAAAFESGGDCPPTLVIGVEGDADNSNAKVSNARQQKLGFPSLTDWRWDGSEGTFLVFTIDKTTGCTTGNANHGYAVWDGTRWNVQYEASGGCPKMFKSAQAALPMHIGGVRYKMYYADITTADATRPAGTTLPFLGPKVLIYGDGTRTGQADRVDFEDWEAQASARNVNFLWPSGDLLDATAEGFIDDYHFLTPTGNLAQQVMYMAITDGTEVPMGAAALLLNP